MIGTTSFLYSDHRSAKYWYLQSTILFNHCKCDKKLIIWRKLDFDTCYSIQCIDYETLFFCFSGRERKKVVEGFHRNCFMLLPDS